MLEKYLDLMEKALSAYSDEHILRYFDRVKETGLKEHGFPRLTSNIGILIANGRRGDLLPAFIEMMDLCCQEIPRVKAANDFSVREIVCCISEVESSASVPKEKIKFWREQLSSIVAESCYSKFATAVTDDVRNWALFSAVSEYFRVVCGVGGDMKFVELQLAQQLRWLDENGMYCDEATSDVYQPIMYDLVPRGLFSLLLNQGYRGKHYKRIDEALKKAGLITLGMQSPNGEMGFGGRSNQFLHNEAWLVAVFEYEAKRYSKEGNADLAAKFKAASARALDVTEKWLNKEPIRHIKNRFLPETQYGCERYAYFDKYMITVASNLWAAYLISDDGIAFERQNDKTPCITKTSERFHKLFVKAGGYGLEFDFNADPEFDANGLGRVHRADAPSAICLSCPCPSHPHYTVDIDEPNALSLGCAICSDDVWHLSAENGVRYEIVDARTAENAAYVNLNCHFCGERCVKEYYKVGNTGVEIEICGEDDVGFCLPAFCFDGECMPEILVCDHSLVILYEGWSCRYETDGVIEDLDRLCANRNGHYRTYLAVGKNKLNVKIEIKKQK